MVRAIKGSLIKCDPSIKALIVDIDSKRHDIIIEELDDTNLLVSTDKIQFIKAELERILSKNAYNAMEAEEAEKQK
ncbi:TFIIH complex subunit [Saccharomycopsis crataegensis]|uniref:General transcription and DNA repair factor IIH subunit TFB5 n=1 Tax=Saccharomycopsis crataegensis TaxID=43959 RepID=A0AAV5QH11_9ASCO|nr:TFIIH complex subunit [Saccharomycopsis crataegensis]